MDKIPITNIGFEKLEESVEIDNIESKNKKRGSISLSSISAHKESLIERISSWFIEDQVN